MDNTEAKLILSAYRPDGQDAHDTKLSEAVEQANLDPELKEWFAKEQAFDREMSAKLKQIPVPTDLKASILAGQRLTQNNQKWGWQKTWAIAATFFVLGMVAALTGESFLNATSPVAENQGNGTPHFAEYQNDVMSVVESGFSLDHKAEQVSQSKNWLKERGAPVYKTLPDRLKESGTMGCKIVEWRGNQVSLLCFKDDSMGVVHLFVINKSGLKEVPQVGTLEIKKSGKLPMASWSDEEKAYVLVGHDSEVPIKDFL